MGMSRPSMQEVQRPLVIGILAGVLVGCFLGLAVGTYYAWQVDPAVYVGGARPNEWNPEYTGHYISTVVDSYNVNRDVGLASERLKVFDASTQIRSLGELMSNFVANGQAAEAQVTSELAGNLKTLNGWEDQTVQDVILQLTDKYKDDPARSQGISSYSAALTGTVPQQVEPTTEEAPVPEDQAQEESAEAAGGGGLLTTTQWIGCCLGLLVIAIAIWLFGRFRFNRLRYQKEEVVWEGEGPAPLKVWSGTYTLGQDNYDEFFTIETVEGDFLGESGMGIMKTVAGTSDPKQVTAFDVGLFDKTDITTLSRVVMSEGAHSNDQELLANIENNPLAEPVLAEPGKEFVLETSALRVVAKIEEMSYADATNMYFNTLKVALNVFLQEGADLRIGSMDIPEEYQ